MRDHERTHPVLDVAAVDPDLVSENSSLAAAIGQLVDRSRIKAGSYRSEFIRAVILNSYAEATEISLFNKFHGVLTTMEVRDVLQGLRAPYRDIAIYGGDPSEYLRALCGQVVNLGGTHLR